MAAELTWHPYVTRSRHIAYGDGALPGLKVIKAGTPCLATRLPDYRIVLTFDTLSIILTEHWYLEGVEDPRLIAPKWVRELQDIEDARFIEYLNLAIETLQNAPDTPVSS
jgi:hypothetical protein